VKIRESDILTPGDDLANTVGYNKKTASTNRTLKVTIVKVKQGFFLSTIVNSYKSTKQHISYL